MGEAKWHRPQRLGVGREVGAVFSRAVKQDILEHNPAHGIMRNPTQTRERVLSEAELPKFPAGVERAASIPTACGGRMEPRLRHLASHGRGR